MARAQHPPSDTLEELDSLAHRLGDWLMENARLVLAILAGILLAAAAVGGWVSWSHAREGRAAGAVAEVRDAYAAAMGAEPGAVEILEPANPETARQARETFATRFQEVGLEHAGTTAALEAHLEAGALLTELGRPEDALEVWQQGLAAAGGDSPVRGLLLARVARVHEQAGRFGDAAEAHERAAAIETFPLRDLALADAARSWVVAGQPDRALDAWGRLQSRAPDASVPDHVRARLEELAAAR